MKLRQAMNHVNYAPNRLPPEVKTLARWRAMKAQIRALRRPGNTRLRDQALRGILYV